MMRRPNARDLRQAPVVAGTGLFRHEDNLSTTCTRLSQIPYGSKII